ncbi:MAG: outer membrane protein assembly factor BamD [Salibacteraceae bacterium]
MKHINGIVVLICIVFLSSCTEYRKVLKSTDMQYKYDMALSYFKDGKFVKAYPLLEELYIVYRGTDKGEKIAYYQARCDFKMEDYMLAAHRFGQFYKNYPNSEYKEQSQFMSAFCNYKLSPKWSLDQRDTYRAIRSLQLFTIDYPNSTKIDSCNTLLDELRYKIEYKEYRAAKLFFNMENYQSAQVSFDSFIKEYPASKYREECWFLKLKSGYLLAANSVDDKKLERIELAKEAYVNFVDRFPQSKWLKQAGEMYDALQKLEETTKNIS